MIKDCKSDSFKCGNCQDANLKLGLSLDVNHSVNRYETSYGYFAIGGNHSPAGCRSDGGIIEKSIDDIKFLYN